MDEKTRLAAELAAQMIAARAFSPTYSVNLLREGKDTPEDVVRAALDGMAFGTAMRSAASSRRHSPWYWKRWKTRKPSLSAAPGSNQATASPTARSPGAPGRESRLPPVRLEQRW